MSNIIVSANMSLPIPVVGQDPGPDWAQNINSCLTILDQHDHGPGSGVAVNPSGININSDLTFNDSNATNLRSLRLSPQSSPLALPSDLGCIYESGVDLYFNDGNGNIVRITQAGALAGTPGSISNLVSPASAAYVSGNQTFVWQSAVATPANMDFGFAIFRNPIANSKGLTLEAPAAMGADFSIVLPNLPASTSILTIDSSGNMAATQVFPLTSAAYAAGSVNTAAIGNAQVTRAKLEALGQQEATLVGTQSLTVGTQDITGLTCNITTTGRPVVVSIAPLVANAVASMHLATSTDGGHAFISIFRDGSPIVNYTVIGNSIAAGLDLIVNPSCVSLDTGATSGAHTYLARITLDANCTGSISNVRLVVYES